MRTLTLFAMALFGTAVLADDASAIGKRKRGQSSSGCSDGGSTSYGGSYGMGYTSASSCCGDSATGSYANYSGHAGTGYGTTLQGTDGQYYTQGADGSYYASSSMTTLGGFTTQPSSSYYPGTYRGPNPYQGGVMPAGYRGTPGSVYPAGGTPPLTMPGVMPPRR